jgi:hypothetical protein
VTPFLIFLAVAAALIALAILQRQRRSRRETYIDSYEFPQGVRQRVRKRYPHLTEAQLDLVMQALREYFHLCRKAGDRLLAMPSQVVDAAWHEFILFTRNYRAFCQRALGRFLHHTPTEAMAGPTQASEGIQRTWRLACLRAGIDPRGATAIPLLFAIDSQLAIPDGFNYVLNCTLAGAAANRYCASDIGTGGGCGSGCAGSGCSSGDGGGGGDGGCGGGGGD